MADVIDFALAIHSNEDLGAVLSSMKNHYCGTLTFTEQQNVIEYIRQGSTEEDNGFLLRVGSLVRSLGKNLQVTISKIELEAL